MMGILLIDDFDFKFPFFDSKLDPPRTIIGELFGYGLTKVMSALDKAFEEAFLFVRVPGETAPWDSTSGWVGERDGRRSRTTIGIGF